MSYASELGKSGRNPLPISDNYVILKYLEQKYGDIGYFVNSQSVVKVDENHVKLYQLKLDTGEYINLYFE